MKRLTSCKFNIDSGCAELCFSDESMISIRCTTIENSIKTTMNGRSELDWLITTYHSTMCGLC